MGNFKKDTIQIFQKTIIKTYKISMCTYIIIIIDKLDIDTLGVQTQYFASPNDIASPDDIKLGHNETQDFVSLPDGAKNTFGPQSQNLASIIRGFKIGVIKLARTQNPNFAWQPRYHDHIIRNQKAHENISNYIINNPANWQKNKFH